MKFSDEEKAMWLEDWEKSGKSARVYAKENGIAPQTFVNWTRKNSESEEGFIEIPIQKMPQIQEQSAREILIEKGEVKIHIPLAISCSELHAIFGALGSAV